jgi:hypothetical protein
MERRRRVRRLILQPLEVNGMATMHSKLEIDRTERSPRASQVQNLSSCDWRDMRQGSTGGSMLLDRAQG